MGKSPIHSRIFADFEADNEVDNSNIGNKTANVYKKIPVCSGFYIISEKEDVLENGNYESPLEYNNVNWLIIELLVKIQK